MWFTDTRFDFRGAPAGRRGHTRRRVRPPSGSYTFREETSETVGFSPSHLECPCRFVPQHRRSSRSRQPETTGPAWRRWHTGSHTLDLSHGGGPVPPPQGRRSCPASTVLASQWMKWLSIRGEAWRQPWGPGVDDDGDITGQDPRSTGPLTFPGCGASGREPSSTADSQIMNPLPQ